MVKDMMVKTRPPKYSSSQMSGDDWNIKIGAFGKMLLEFEDSVSDDEIFLIALTYSEYFEL